MTFTETSFWWLTAIVFVVWLSVRRHYRLTVTVLLAGSIVFYGYHHWPLLFLLFVYCVVDWGVALWIQRSSRPRLIMGLGVGFNLLILGYWKYTPLLLRSLADCGLHVPVPSAHDWIIPFGISFYAFTGIAYLVEVYRGIVKAERSFIRYTLSAMFFPHLVAGPILLPDEFLTKLKPDVIPQRPEEPLEALALLARGLFKKMVLADRLALAADPFFAHVADPTTAGVWALPFVYAYALQIYFDFSGYTDIARGLGLQFGYRWPENFDRPYLATSIQDFWRRWHITLSRFLRDYLYIPLGGSRGGPWRTCRNLMITMLLGGLWHGANWSFVIWGGLHGTFLIINRLWTSSPWSQWTQSLTGPARQLWTLCCWVLTFHCVCLAWCFFRLTDFSQSLLCVQKCLTFDAAHGLGGQIFDPSLGLLLVAYALADSLFRTIRDHRTLGEVLHVPQRRPLVHGFLWGFSLAVLLLALLLSPGGEAPPFIYFQF